jgi:hypothetical protein
MLPGHQLPVRLLDGHRRIVVEPLEALLEVEEGLRVADEDFGVAELPLGFAEGSFGENHAATFFGVPGEEKIKLGRAR